MSLATRRATGDAELLAGLRRRDEAAFLELVRRHQPLMVRIARAHVPSRAVAEEVVQETWLAMLQGLDRFEERASVKTWLFRILVNRARTRGEREARTVPLSSVVPDDEERPSVDPDRFLDAQHPRWPGHWTAPPARWEELPEERLLSRETLALARGAIDALPGRQREVILLRDVDGWPAEEVCEALGISEGNQRVLLHRARSRVREALESHLGPAVAA